MIDQPILSEASEILLRFSALNPIARAILVASGVIGVAVIAATAAKRASASTRHAMWLLALCVSLAAAPFAAIGPVLEIETDVQANSTGVAPPDARPLPAPLAALHTDARLAGTGVRSAAIGAIRDHGAAITGAVWIFGLLVIALRCIAGHIGIARIVARSRAMVPDREYLVRRTAHLAGVEGAFAVRLADDVDVPFTVGVRRPIVVLPMSAASWTAERLHIVLVHELAHVARMDYVAQLVATAARAIYWFNPIVWLAASRLRAEAEQAADDRVLSSGVDGITYASHLLALAGPPRAARLSMTAAVGMARNNRLERRFHAMLDSTRSRRIVPLRHQVAAGAAAIVMAVPLVGFRMVSAPTLVATSHATPTVPSARPPLPAPTVVAADTIVEKALAVTAGERLSIELATGGEVIVQAWEQPRIRMRATLSGDQWRETRLSLDRVSGGVELRTSYEWSRRTSRNSNRFELWVPRRFSLHVSSAGGGIRINGVEGTFTGATGGGEIVIENAKGEARLTTGGGEIHLSGSDLNGSVTTGGGEATVTTTTGNVRVSSGSGPVIRSGESGQRSIGIAGTVISSSGQGTTIGGRTYAGAFSLEKAGGAVNLAALPNGGVISTGGGDIAIGSSGGRLSVLTGGGNISVSRMGGDVIATTGAGAVEISVVNTDGSVHSVEVHSGSGRIAIDLPANIDARFDIESAYTERHGPTEIRSDFPVSVTETQDWDGRNGTPRRYVRATGTAGAGRGLIRIRTVNGDVVIRRR